MKNHYSTITTNAQVTGDYIILTPINKSVRQLKGILPESKISLSCKEIDAMIKDSYDRS